MTMQSRKELALIMLVYGALLSRTQARTICSCYNNFESNYINRPHDTIVHSQQCEACSNEVHLASLTDTCDNHHAESLTQEHGACSGPTSPIRYYRCDLGEGVYTCRIPRRLYRCGLVAIPFYSSILLKYRPSDSSVNQSSTPLVLLNNVSKPMISLGNGCSKATVCIDPLRVLHNALSVITLSITESEEVIVNDVIATVVYYNECHQRPRASTVPQFPFNIAPFNRIESAAQEQIEMLRSG
ncbi:uncharacterized protein LOC110461332 [Mizuhopecten yessoensis]|uniref:Uncharacterized protein n=1 Tax=Mizuhopecten yessoensis TaxID=6573 RepID=A0A210Q0G8_MIZYE|nr:uncharacterized protein LOC110461332 [Mizuhopecten yessoensis]OWF42226.1 hypothetical protein KP79_PYT16400 [Mizuhopecten yessoensis]